MSSLLSSSEPPDAVFVANNLMTVGALRCLADQGVVLEICPVSNVELGIFESYGTHPFPALRAAGCKVTLNSDDPPYFWTTLKREYDIAVEHFGLDEAALLDVTRTAIEAAFVDEETRSVLMARLSSVAVS
jgi:adenosine deaminase